MKYKISSTLLVLALVLIMGTVAAADEQGYNGTSQVANKAPTENTIENTTGDNTTKPTGLVIDQQQFQRRVSDGSVQLESYKVREKLVAGVYEDNAFNQYEAVTIQDKTYKFWRGVENTVDDIVVVSSVETENSATAYIRTVFAFPVFSDGETHLHLNFYKPELLEKVEGIAEVEGKQYQLYVYNYDTPLAPGQTTEPSLLEYVFDKDVTTEMFDELGGAYQVLITSQAIQESGFTTFASAFNSAFSNVTANNHPWN